MQAGRRPERSALERYGVTVIVPCIIERWTWQKYGKVPADGKFWMNTNPAL